RALRVLALDNPAPTGHLHWTVDDLPSAVFDSFDGCIDGINVEIEVPTGHRNMGSLGHHAAIAHWFAVAFIEDAINAHGSHIHIANLTPTKELVIELKYALEICCVEFVPADGTGGGWCGAFRRRHRRVGSKDHNGSALRVGHDGEAKHARNVGGGFP